MINLETLEQEVASQQDEQISTPPPLIPKSIPRTQVSNVTAPQGGTLSEAQIDAQLESFMQEAGYTDKDLEVNTGAAAADQAHTKGFMQTVWDLGKSAPMGVLKGLGQIGANAFNVSEEAMVAVSNKVFGTNYRAESMSTTSPTDSAEERSWAKATEIMGTVAGTGVAGAIAVPSMAASATASIGGLIAGFAQNTEDGNLSTALEGTRFGKLALIEPVLSQFSHKPGDTQLVKRLKSMGEGAAMDLAVGGVLVAPSVINDAAKAAGRTRVGNAISTVVKDTRDVVRANVFGKKPVAGTVEAVKPTQAMDVGNVKILPEEELAAREAAYSQQGAKQAEEFVGVVQKSIQDKQAAQLELGDMGTQAAPDAPISTAGATQPELGVPEALPQQMDLFEMVSELEDSAKLRRDSVNLEINMREQKAAAFGERQAAKQRSLFRGRQAKVDDPRLSGEQLSLFNIDDVDAAGFSYDPKQASFFDENFNKSFPDQFAVSEEKFIEIEQAKQAPVVNPVEIEVKVAEAQAEVRAANATKTPAEPGVDPAPNQIKVTTADDSMVEAVDRVLTEKNRIYAAKKASGETLSYNELQDAAFEKNNQPGEIDRILSIPDGQGMSPLEMAQIQDIAIRAAEELRILEAKVAEGLAHDLALAELDQARENFYNISMKYASHGTDAAHSLGIRGSMRAYAKAGDPAAIQAIGTEGKIQAIGKVIKSLGGRSGIEDEAKFFSQVMDLVYKKGARNGAVLGNLTPAETAGVVSEVGNILKKVDSDFILKSSGEIQLKSRGRSIVEGATGWMFDNMILHPNTIANTWSGMPFDMGLRVGTNYTMALFSGAKGNIPEMIMRVDKANIYGKSLSKNFIGAIKASAREFAGVQNAATDVIVGSPAKVPEYLKKFGRQPLATTTAEAATTMDAVRSILVPVRGWTIGLGRKFLASSDVFINHLGYNSFIEAELFERATGMARDMKLTGDKASAFVDDFVSRGLKSPPKDLHEQGLIEGAKLGYRADLTDFGIGGVEPLAFVEEILHRGPALKIISPFFRAFGNTVQNTTKYLPGLAFTLKSSRANLEKSVAEQLTGTGALVGMASLFMDGHVTLPDFFNQSPYKKFGEVDKDGKPTAAQPLSIRNSDGTSTKLPLGGAMEKFMKLSGYIALASKYMPEEELGAYISGGTMALVKTMGVDDQFRGFNLVSDIVSSIAKGEDAGKQVLDSTVSIAERFIPFNRIGKDINIGMEDFTPDASGVSARGAKDWVGRTDSAGLDYVISSLENRLKAIVPGSSKELPPEYNILGEPVPAFNASALDMPGVLVVTNEKSSDVMQRLQALSLHASMFAGDVYEGLNIARLPKTLTISEGTTVQLNQREYSRMQSYYGGYNPDTGAVMGSTLRDGIAEVFAKNNKTWNNVETGKITPAEFNEMVAKVHSVFSARKKYAQEQMKNEASIIAKVNETTEVKKEAKARGLQLINTVIGR